MQCDVLIIGSGVAGLSLAIKLAEAEPEMSIVVLSKTALSDTNTAYAQGGIAAVMDSEKDNIQLHIQDTLNSGGGLSVKEAARTLSAEIPMRIEELMRFGATFDKSVIGKLDLGLEGGHSRNRIVHHKDQTGIELMRTLQNRVAEFENVVVREGQTVISLIRGEEENTCSGAWIFEAEENKIYSCLAMSTVLATGGCGQLFLHTTNPEGATGDGIALAYEIGADISNMQYVQFHPTTLYEAGASQYFLITEALRGKGAHILNSRHERFMFKYDTRGELATRDLVSQAIFSEMERSKSRHVWLDLRHLVQGELEDEFPYVMAKLISIGLNPAKDLIPITPAAHYQCGGITTDLAGRTTVNGLFALGECANNGLHGANRLASNSLAEGLVFAAHACRAIVDRPRLELPKPTQSPRFSAPNPSMEIQKEWKAKLKSTVQKGFMNRNDQIELELCLGTLSALEEGLTLRFGECLFQREFQLMCSVARIILHQALENNKPRSEAIMTNAYH